MRARLSQAWKKARTAIATSYRWLSQSFEAPALYDPTSSKGKPHRWVLSAFSFIFSATMAALIVCPGPRNTPVPQFQVGDIAEQDVVAPLTAEIEPRELPKGRDELSRRVAPVFDYDETTIPMWIRSWVQAFATVRQRFFTGDVEQVRWNLQLADRISEIIQRETGQSLIASDIVYLTKNRFSKDLEDSFQELTKPLLGRLIAQTDLFPSYYSTGIIVRQINLGLNETLITDVSRIWSLDHARQLVNHVLASSPKQKKESMQHLASMLQYLVIPNLRFNGELTERRINIALGRKEVPLIGIQKNQILIKSGERLSENQLEILEAIRHLASQKAMTKRFFLVTLVLFLFFQVLFNLDLTRRSFLRLSLKNALLFAVATGLTLGGMKLTLPFIQLVLTPLHIKSGGEFLIPVATGGILIQLLMGRELAHTFALLLGISAGILLEQNLFYGIWVFLVTSSAIQSMGDCKQRTDLYKCGAWSGVVGAVLAVVFDLQHSLGLQSFDWIGLVVRSSFAFISGILGSILASTLIPVFEAILGYTTNLKLLELSNFNHPLLHNLMMKAPGTYHHSIMVGSLAEIAADRIKANSLLARVSAYYHDIGKMVNPLYFIENQSPQYNPHDHLSPTISARILFSHVKNGARMGREHNLGESVNDIIQQHHGTTLTTFFYNKAKELEKAGDPSIAESEYRYPGPRPQTREAAIVMIADACEASTRSIPDPTPEKIQSMVHNIINKRFLDQQFHDCDLTLRDLQVIEDSMSRTLLSLYHHRIEYPGQRQDLVETTQEMSRKQ